MTDLPNDQYLQGRCDKHQVPLHGGPPELEFVVVDEKPGTFQIRLFPHMFCSGMWRNEGQNDADEIASEICWDHWVVEVVRI